MNLLLSIFRALGTFVAYFVAGVLHRIAADQLYFAATWRSLRLTYNGPHPASGETFLSNVSFSIDSLPFDLSVGQMRLLTIVAALPIAVGIGSLSNRLLRTGSLPYLPIALCAFFVGFYGTSGGVLPPSTANTLFFSLISVAVFYWLFGRQKAPNNSFKVTPNGAPQLDR